MRKLFCLLFVLLYAGSLAAKPGPGIMPKRGKSKKPIDSYIGNARVTLGPRYSKPDDPPSADQIPGAIAASDPNSPNSIAAQSLGFQSNCGQDIRARADALNAQLQGILAKVKADYAHQIACSGTLQQIAACQIQWATQAVADASPAIAISAQLQALQAQAAACSGNGQASAQPPAVTMGAVAKRFGFSLPSAAGQGGSGAAFGSNSIFNGGSALAQLKLLESQGEGADFDGRNGGAKLGKAFSHYGDAARRAAGLGPRIQAGRQLANSKESFDDPRDTAQAEYLKINYKELGPKYEALVQERHTAAENVADQALSGLGPNAPLMDPAMQPMIQLDESKATALEGPGLNAATAWDSTKEGMKDAVVEKLPLQWQSLEKIAEIDQAVAKAWDLRDDLMDAVNEMGSGSQSTASTEKMLAKLDQYFGDVKDATFEKNPFKSLLGSD